jgi:hypothetical protein
MSGVRRRTHRGANRRDSNDGGQVVPLAAALVGLCCVALLALVPVAGALDDRARARTAADAAALAGAADGELTAREVAGANGAELVEIERNGDEVVVQVRVGEVEAYARARATRPPAVGPGGAAGGPGGRRAGLAPAMLAALARAMDCWAGRSRWSRACGPGLSKRRCGSAGRRTPTRWRRPARPITSAGWPSTCRGLRWRSSVASRIRQACANRCPPPTRSTSSSVAHERPLRSEYHEKDLVGLLGRGDGRAVDSPRCRLTRPDLRPTITAKAEAVRSSDPTNRFPAAGRWPIHAPAYLRSLAPVLRAATAPTAMTRPASRRRVALT